MATIRATSGAVTTGTAASDTMYGHEGADTLYGRAGDDTIWGADGADRLYGDSGTDRLYGEAGDDVLMGGTGVSTDTIVEQAFREIRAFRIYDGASEVHRMSLAKRAARRAGG